MCIACMHTVCYQRDDWLENLDRFPFVAQSCFSNAPTLSLKLLKLKFNHEHNWQDSRKIIFLKRVVVLTAKPFKNWIERWRQFYVSNLTNWTRDPCSLDQQSRLWSIQSKGNQNITCPIIWGAMYSATPGMQYNNKKINQLAMLPQIATWQSCDEKNVNITSQ